MLIRPDAPFLAYRIYIVCFVNAKIVQMPQLLDFKNRCRERDSSNVDLGFIATVATELSTVIVVVRMEVSENAPHNALLIVVVNVEHSPSLLNLRW